MEDEVNSGLIPGLILDLIFGSTFDLILGLILGLISSGPEKVRLILELLK